jgi:hypothetical protein
MLLGAAEKKLCFEAAVIPTWKRILFKHWDFANGTAIKSSESCQIYQKGTSNFLQKRIWGRLIFKRKNQCRF